MPEISVDQLASKMAAGAVTLFDVRNPDEFESGRVPGARLVPLGEVPDRVGEFPTDTEVLVICQAGGRSARAVEYLRAHGVNAVNIAGGTGAWINAGKPVETGGIS